MAETWAIQYIERHPKLKLSSFVLMVQKCNLVKILVFRAKYICTDDTLKNDLQNIRNILKDNRFPDKFIEKYAHST